MAAISRPSIGVAVITHNAVDLLRDCISPLLVSPLQPKILVVNSSSNDGTVELARELGAETLIIPRNEFNHGTTRELARRKLAVDIAIMITPDAKPLGPELIDNLVRPIREGRASVCYARQLPHDGADFFEAFARRFNYTEKSELRSIDDLHAQGAYVFFCSNSCAAWSNAALDMIGGFERTLMGEDTIAAAKLVRSGHRIAYNAEAVVKHSHHYSLMQEFKRLFDAGYVRALHKDLLLAGRSDERRGNAYAVSMMRTLSREQPHLIPYAAANIFAKYLGYRVGFHGHALPLWFKRRASGQDYFWQGVAATGAE
jgi:rhamnosyltransferase